MRVEGEAGGEGREAGKEEKKANTYRVFALLLSILNTVHSLPYLLLTAAL